ncbi:MAG TPA: hypothetical protein VK465_11785 [Fibrobacteria bacterium]|nr:hypothetical protein [Fibrobacteria bacterium]
MSKKRHSPEFKTKVALEALKGVKPLQALAAEAEVNPIVWTGNRGHFVKKSGLKIPLNMHKTKRPVRIGYSGKMDQTFL